MKYGKLFITLFLISSILFNYNIVKVKADSDENSIFSFNKDGYWKPGDVVTHEFKLNNIWGVECYLNSLYFKYSYIYDLDTKEKYTVEEALESKLLDNYNVDFYIKKVDGTKEKLYEGTIMNLSNTEIDLNPDIFLKLDGSVVFEMTISFDEYSSNEFQNKSLEYIILPEAYKVEYDKGDNGLDKFINSIKTGDNIIFNRIIQAISISLCLIALIIFWKKTSNSYSR